MMQRNHPFAPQQQQQQQLQQQQQQPSFFRGAPVTKLLLGAMIVGMLFTFLLQSSGNNNNNNNNSWLIFDSTRVLQRHEWYLLLTSQVLFVGRAERLLNTALLVYWMRGLEREVGSRWFAVFWGLQMILSAACIAVVLVLVGEPVVVGRMLQNALPFASSTTTTTTASYLHKITPWRFSGPYPFLGALLVWFHSTQPRKYPQLVSLLGFHFSEKAILYLWCWPVLTAAGWHSILASMTGGISWWLYRNFLHGLVDVPDSVAAATARTFARWMEPSPPILVATGAVPAAQRHVARQAAAAAAAAAAVQRPVVPVEPDPAAIEQLTNMGFGRAQVVQALQATNNNVERAADRLLTTAAH